MTNHTPTPEQEAIRAAARGTKDNLIIHALAGAAKTSTLILLARAVQVPILSLAFNVKIAKEMRERMPGNATSLTLNSVGHRTWAKTIGRQPVVDKDKVYNLCRAAIDALPMHEKSAGFEIFTNLMNAIRIGKSHGYVPNGSYKGLAKGLLNDEEFFANLDEEPSDLMQDLIRKISHQSMEMAFKGQIDYDDQVLMPTIFPASFDSYPLTLIDETQDLSELNHTMLKKLVKEKRLMAVGDENQSIYGFRGAHADSMDLMQQAFGMKRFDLTISFRCPIEVVKEARFRAPAMQYPEWAKPGLVTHAMTWSAESVHPDAVILCRNNAPLFRCAINLLKNGKYPELVGNDVGKGLIKIMKKLGDNATPRSDAVALVEAWKQDKLLKSRNPGSVADQAECMQVFLEQGETLGDAVAYAEHLIMVSGGIKLMTIHKSKGLEWPNVYLLDRHLINKERTQERNLLYVAMTRSQETLTYINTDHFKGL